MDLIRISEKKLKVMLSRKDMEKYAFDGEKLDYCDDGTRLAFRSILDEAKSRTGFDTADEKVLIQVYPSKSGGCEMFVTKLGEKEKTKNVCPVPTRSDAFFRFDRLEDLTKSCRLLRENGFHGESRLYCAGEKRGRFFLSLPKDSDRIFFGIVSAFGFPAESGFLYAYLTEYGTLLCPEGAVEKMAACG